jgi:predicted thioesterase
MRADYDKTADTIQIELEPTDRLDGDVTTIPGVFVGIRHEKPVLIDLVGTRVGVEQRLTAVGKCFELDAEALVAAAQAALSAPDRAVTVDVGLPTTP